jgi:hypothetical protein
MMASSRLTAVLVVDGHRIQAPPSTMWAATLTTRATLSNRDWRCPIVIAAARGDTDRFVDDTLMPLTLMSRPTPPGVRDGHDDWADAGDGAAPVGGGEGA